MSYMRSKFSLQVETNLLQSFSTASHLHRPNTECSQLCKNKWSHATENIILNFFFHTQVYNHVLLFFSNSEYTSTWYKCILMSETTIKEKKNLYFVCTWTPYHLHTTFTKSFIQFSIVPVLNFKKVIFHHQSRSSPQFVMYMYLCSSKHISWLFHRITDHHVLRYCNLSTFK